MGGWDCLDSKDLNAAIQREHHVPSTLEEILPKLTTVFSNVDAKCGYWNVVRDKGQVTSPRLTPLSVDIDSTACPLGWTCHKKSFKPKLAKHLKGCEGVAGIADEIVVLGKNREEHDRNMYLMLKRCEDTGLKLNPDKCFVKQEKITFYGVVCGQGRIQPDPN